MGDSGVTDYGTSVQMPSDPDHTAPTSAGDGTVDFDDFLRYLLGLRNDLASKLATGAFDMGANKVKSSAVPTVGADLVNKTYADALIALADAMVFQGVIDCSANPNYPAADRGWTYRVSVAGKIGGASGTNVEAGDLLICLTDSTASGTQAAVGAQWEIAQANIDGAVTGPASSTASDFATFSGTSGKVIQDSGLSLDTGTLGTNSDTKVPSQKAVKTYVDAGDAARSPALTPTAPKTTNYTAVAGDFVPVDTTSGAVTVTLPTAPADGSRIGVKLVIQGGTNAVTVNCGGSDVYNKAGGVTTLTLTLLAQAVSLQYKATGGIWYIVADDLPLADLDARFETPTNKGAVNGYMGLDASGNGSSPPKTHGRQSSSHSDLWLPASVIASTYPWWTGGAYNNAMLSTGRGTLNRIRVPANKSISYIAFHSGATALVTGTHQWFCLADATTLSTLAKTSDDIATAWAATSEKKLAISRVVTDAAITSGTNTLTSATAAFTVADNGRDIMVLGAGAAGAVLGASSARVTMTYVNATTVTLSANAGTTVSGATAYIQTPYVVGASDVDLYAGIVVTAATVPTLSSITVSDSSLTARAPAVVGNSQTGLTDPASAPGTWSTPSGATAFAYAELS